jgi:hypothetical protein
LLGAERTGCGPKSRAGTTSENQCVKRRLFHGFSSARSSERREGKPLGKSS